MITAVIVFSNCYFRKDLFRIKPRELFLIIRKIYITKYSIDFFVNFGLSFGFCCGLGLGKVGSNKVFDASIWFEAK